MEIALLVSCSDTTIPTSLCTVACLVFSVVTCIRLTSQLKITYAIM